jgi:hypothetical protein
MLNINRAEKFIIEPFATVPTAAPSTATIIEIPVPTKVLMRILEIGNFCRTPAAWGTIRWDFFHDDLPLYPFQQIYDQIAFGTTRQAVKNIEIRGGHRFRVRGYNGSGADVVMGISLCYEFEYQE